MEKSWSQYLEKKRMKVLNTIIPVLKPFGITKVDYVIDEKNLSRNIGH